MPKLFRQAFQAALKDLDEEKVKLYKDVVKKTLQKLEDKQKQHREIVREIQILKKDIQDLSYGRLDKIEERQKLDSKAKEVSAFTVEKKEIKDKGADMILGGNLYATWTLYDTDNSFDVNPNFCSSVTSGTYVLDSGSIKYI